MSRRGGGRRIGIDVTAALAQGGGIGRYTRELVHALVATDPTTDYRLFSARVTAPQVPDPLPATPNATHTPGPLGEAWLYRLWYRLRLPVPVQVVTGRLDLFHSPDFVLPPVSGGIPTLLTVHDLSFVHFPNVYPPALVTYLNKVVPWSINRATHILADSESTCRDLQQVWGVAADKITVLLSGVNPRFRRVADPTATAAVRSRYRLGEQPFILTVGTVQPRKNYPMLVRAFRPVAERHPHQLVIAGGKGWMPEELLAEIERQGLSERVKLTGFVEDADLPTLYSAADVFAFPSLYEGFGLPLLEAMACGTPVLSSSASSLPEVARGPSGDAAVLLLPEDEAIWTESMLTLIENPEERQRLVNAGYEQVARFSWSRAARDLLDLYDRLL